MEHNTAMIERQKNIALVAHDHKKQDLLEWARYNRALIAQHEIYATGTTGKLLEEELGVAINKLRSGPLGGDQQIGAKIATRNRALCAANSARRHVFRDRLSGLDVQKGYVEILETLGRLEAVLLQGLEERQDVANTGEVHAMLAGQRLDGLELHQIALRVPAAVGDRPLRLDHVEVLVHHQRPRMGLQDLRRNAERVDRLVQVDVRGVAGHRCLRF